MSDLYVNKSVTGGKKICEYLLSVVLATFNGQDYLRQQLDSLLKQSYSHFELIVVDDASTDATLLILKEYAEKDNRIKIYPSTKNIGLVANFERGLSLAKGEYIALADQDDVFHPNKLERLVRKLEENKLADLVVSDLRLIDQNGNLIAESMWQYHKSKPMSGKPFQRLVLSNFATGCAMLFRRRLLALALPFPPDVVVHDWWLAVVAASHKSGGIVLENEALVDYRQHSENVVGAKPLVKINLSSLFKVLSQRHFMQKIISESYQQALSDAMRVRGYLQRKTLWNQAETGFIEKAADLFQTLYGDNDRPLLKRLALIPERVRIIRHTHRLRTSMKVIFLSLFNKRGKLHITEHG